MKLKLSLISLSWIICLCVKAQVVVNPVFDKTDNPEFRIVKVKITKDTTFVYCLYQAEEQSWANISKETILRDCQTDKKYRIYRSVGLPLAPEKKTFLFARKQNVILCFPHVAPTLSTFDIIESNEKDGFNIYGIDFKHENDSSLYNYSIEHAVSLSSKADFFFSAGNYQKAIEYEEQAIYIKKAYFGRKSFQYAASVINLASYYNQASNYEKAIFWGKEDLNLCAELLGSQSDYYGNSLLNLASYYHSAGNWDKAEAYKRQAVELYENLHGKENEKYAFAISNLAQTLYAKGNYKDAISYAEKGLTISEKLFGKESLEYSMSLHDLTHSYAAIGDYEKAIKYGLQALECDSIQYGVENKEFPLYVTTLGNLSDYYQYNGNDIEALHYKKKCIRIWRSIGNEDNYLKEVYSLLFSGRDMIGIEKRIEIVKHELEDLPNFVNTTSISVAIILKQLASYYWMTDDGNGAIRCCDKALEIYKINGDINTEEYAELLSLKCKYQSHSDQNKEAIITGEKAKKTFDSLDVRSIKYAEMASDLAWAYGNDYNFEKSISLQLLSTEIYEEANDWLSLAEAYNNVSFFYQSAEKLDSAVFFIKKAIAVLNNHDDAEQIIREDAERLGDNSIVTPFALSKIKQRHDYDKINFQQTLARIYQKEGRITDAIDTEEETLIFIKNIGDIQAYSLHLMIIAQYYLSDKQYNKAKDCVEQTFQLEDNQFNIANSKILLSYICFEMGDTIKALQYAEESASYFKTTRDVENFINAEYVLSLFYWKSHEYTKAEYYLSESLDLLRDDICNEFIRMTSEQKQRIWGIYEKYFMLYRNIIEKSSRNNGLLLSKLFDYVLFSKSLLLDTDIQKDTNRIKITWKDIQKKISDDDIVIEFLSTIEEEGNYYTYHALILDKSKSTPRMITLYSETQLEEIKKTTTRNIRDIVGELIWKPILAQYSNAKNIYFSPDGILHIIPIEYYNVSSTTNMFEQYNMCRLSSTKEFVNKHNNKMINSAVLFGGLDYNQLKETATGTSTKEISSVWRGIAERGGFDPLFNTLVETQEIKDILDRKNITTTLYTGEKGSEKSFRNLSNQNHSIIHLATHGMYVNPNVIDEKKEKDNFAFLETIDNKNDPVKEDATLTHSFLVMAGGNRLITRDSVSDSNNDGILTSKEISQLNLEGVDLVVLSACESALGDIYNGGIYGLQRGFKKAGVNTILMSLDKVDDEATRILMVEFYKNLMAGKSKHQSLKEAQNHLRQIEDGKYNDPKYWASFIMLDGLN